jgi:hypothetical protein
MSWSATTKIVPAGDATERIKELAPPDFDSAGLRVREQVIAARLAATAIAAEMNATWPHEFLVINANGHAEPGHPNRDGWSPDYISVSVGCICTAENNRRLAQAEADAKEAAKAKAAPEKPTAEEKAEAARAEAAAKMLTAEADRAEKEAAKEAAKK